jgi:hypothetical protein
MTRAALGIGIGLLLSERIGGSARRAVGWALVASGALVTIPLAMEVFHKGRLSEEAGAGGNARMGAKDRSRNEGSIGASAY